MRELILLVLVINSWCYDLSTSCGSSSKYFNTISMTCEECPSNQVASEDSLSCTCSPGYAKTVSTRDLAVFSCYSCLENNMVPSSDQYECQSCPGSISNNMCACPGSSYIRLEFDSGHNYLAQQQCVNCGQQGFDNSNFYQCQYCPDPNMSRDPTSFQCTCPSSLYSMSQNSCVLNSAISSLNPTSPSTYYVTYQFYTNDRAVGSSQIQSNVSEFYLLKAADDCANKNSIIGCQVLANLCVLQLYYDKYVACSYFMKTASTRSPVTANPNFQDPGWATNMPWLYYERTSAQVLNANSVQMTVTFDPNDPSKVNLMTFKMAQFRIDGTFLGFVDLTDQLILCPHSLQDSKSYRKFGTNVEIDCQLDLTQFLNATSTIFYDLYLVDQDGTLIDVPVVIQNYVDSNGNSPNAGSDPNSWKLFRRFFIYDNLSGVQNNGNLLVIQYLKTAKIVFTLRSDLAERIYVPYLLLNYQAMSLSYLLSGNNLDKISFISEYTMDTSHFWTIAQGIFIGINILVGLCWVVRLYVWNKINPQKDSPTTYNMWLLLTGIRMLITTWGFLCFWYLFGLTGYWFIFYKLQYNVYALVPPLNTFSTNYYPFEVVLALVISGCLFNAVYNIYRQSNLDLILIDWEKPNRDPIEQIRPEDQGKPISVYKEHVSAWRYLFIVNELNELQSLRYVSVEFTYFLFLFFFDGLGWSELATSQPNTNVGYSDNTSSPVNPVLRYFLTCSLLLVIAYAQFVIRKILSLWIATPVQNFIDLCSVSNVSVLVLDEFLHGYYIHGVSPNGHAELGIDELLESLHKEAAGKSRPRGIMPEDKTGLQSFEVFIPTAIRKTYNNLAKQPVEADIHVFRERKQESSGLPQFPQALPENMSIERAQEIRLELNRRLKIYIAGLVKDSKSQILDKSPWQRFLRMPPVDLSLLDGTPYFYRDPAVGFESSFLMGKEFSFILMDIVLYELFDYVTGNAYVAVLIAYIISKILAYIRQKAGEWNLSRKALVNKKFLL